MTFRVVKLYWHKRLEKKIQEYKTLSVTKLKVIWKQIVLFLKKIVLVKKNFQKKKFLQFVKWTSIFGVSQGTLFTLYFNSRFPRPRLCILYRLVYSVYFFWYLLF